MVFRALPWLSQVSSRVPNWLRGTKYENGFCIVVTRKYDASGEASNFVIIPGFPMGVTSPELTSIDANWLVDRYSRSCLS